MSQIPRSFGKGSQDSHLPGALLAAGTEEEVEAGRDIDAQGRASSGLRQLDRAAHRQGAIRLGAGRMDLAMSCALVFLHLVGTLVLIRYS